jgi:peptidoglycan hydrolase-like protein with peptidoglycan-binding domain
MNKTKSSAKKQKKKKIIVTTLAVGATGILGYFGWQYLKKKKQAKKDDIDSLIQNIDKPIVLSNNTTTTVKPKVKTTNIVYKPTVTEPGDDFPLKKGSKGEAVRKLQEALIAKYGKQTLPKYGADGDFGSETTNALIKLGLPTTITQSTFNVIAQGIPQGNPSSVGKELYNAASSKDFNKALAALKNLKSVDDYSSANEQFKQNRLNGVHQTIVNGLLNTFATDSQKQKIKFEFLRMGLQFDGSKWSLSGIDGLPIVTTMPTTVWVNATESVKVPARMVLGNEVSKRLDYTLFENKGKYFLVQTKNVKYL